MIGPWGLSVAEWAAVCGAGCIVTLVLALVLLQIMWPDS